MNEMQRLIVEKLREAVERELPSRLFFCTEHAEIPDGGYIVGASRLDILLSGRKRVELPLATGRAKLTMKPGDAYFSPQGTWEWHAWDTRAELLCIVPRHDYLRVSYYDQRAPSRKPEVRFHHTGRRCSEPVTQLAQMLEREGPVSGASLHLARALAGLALRDCAMEPPRAEGKIAQRFSEICQWLENHFQENIGREQTAAQFGVTPAYLTHIFRQITGEGFHDYLTRIRLGFARSLLAGTDLPVYLVGIQSGFPNPVHFVRRFRELEGLPPGEFRLRERGRIQG